ncbi:MAG: UDP-N-acetylglucosamine diphosphorylase/glucosamine-1-phosphate N-acetyltransferase [Crocinitomix sp.]|jgi:UDP-N-acetylglucosamine diphosphorylase/glucosamine-1-phosphate N-acetyltransferase
MQIIFDDNGLHKRLAPFTLTRPVAEIRFGIMTIRESWEYYLGIEGLVSEIAYLTEDYLYAKFKKGVPDAESITIAGNYKASPELFDATLRLKKGEALYIGNDKIAQKGNIEEKRINAAIEHSCLIEQVWHIFERNSHAVNYDFQLLTKGRSSQTISDTNRISGNEHIFIEEGAKIEHAILNASTGPIYIGKDAEVMEGAMIRGPFALCEKAVVKMGAKIYGATTIGPECKVGGEVSNCVFQSYSNKGHDGFLGNSVVGEWCNIGADTNSSNLKNNYSNVKVYSYETNQIELSDVLFCGLLMGDHSKTGINTMLNTATVVGVSANIFGGGFPPKHIPSFTWGGVEKTDLFDKGKAFQVAENMMQRRGKNLTEGEKAILTYLFDRLA